MSDAGFELRLERAARLIADEAIRPVDAVAIAEAAIRAAGRSRELETPRFAPRRAWFALAAAAVAIVVAIAGSLVLDRVRNDLGSSAIPSTSPSPSSSASPTTAPVGVPNGSAGGSWLADIPADLEFDGNPNANRMSLTVGNGLTASIDLVGRTSGLLRSSFVTLNVGEIRFTTESASSGAVSVRGTPLEACQPGDVGSYQSSTSVDGSRLTLELLDDDCPARGGVFARTWTRLLTVPNGGGMGVVDGFDPIFMVELPPASYIVASSADARTIYQDFPEIQFLSFKDPQGFLDPCDLSKGRRSIEPGADAFVAYFQQLAGFTVDSVKEMTVDGYRAVRLVVHADENATCRDGRLWEWQPKAEPVDGSAWFLNPGVTDSLIIVDHPAGTVMFELLPAPNSLEDQVIGSIRFLHALPTTP